MPLDYNPSVRNKTNSVPPVRTGGVLLDSGLPCPIPTCESSDAYSLYENEGGRVSGHCFSCQGTIFDISNSEHARLDKAPKGYRILDRGEAPQRNPFEQREINSFGLTFEECLKHPFRPLKDRGISIDTVSHYGVRVGVSATDGETPTYHLYPRTEDGEIVQYKVRDLPKKFRSIGHKPTSLEFFGQSVCRTSGKKIYLTEGEIDCMSVYQALKEGSSLSDYNPPVISLPDGSSSVERCITENFEFLDCFDEIVLVFDSDAPGKEARDKACKILAGKVSYISLPEKDPNAMTVLGKSTELKWLLLSNARKYHPDGIVNAKDSWDRYKHSQNQDYFPYPSSMPDLNSKLYGARPGSIITVTSGSGCGKTTFMRELEYHFYKTTQESIACIHLEEDIGETMSGLMSLELNKRLSLPDVQVSEDEERKVFSNLFESGRFSFYDHFGGMDDSNLFSKLKYFATTGHKFIFLDHLSIVVSEFAAQGGERERIDTIMTKLAKFVKEYEVVLFLVVHLKKTDGTTPFELGAVPTLDALRGSGTLKQLSWDVIGLSRNQQHYNKTCANTVELSVLKSRFTGRTGVSDYLLFDDTTGRFLKSTKPENYRPKKRSQGGLTASREF